MLSLRHDEEEEEEGPVLRSIALPADATALGLHGHCLNHDIRVLSSFFFLYETMESLFLKV